MKITAYLQFRYNVSLDMSTVKTESVMTCPCGKSWNLEQDYESSEYQFPPDWEEVKKIGERCKFYTPEELFEAKFRTANIADPVRCGRCQLDKICRRSTKVVSLPKLLVMGFQRAIHDLRTGQRRRNCLVIPSQFITLLERKYELQSVWFHQARVNSPVDDADQDTRTATSAGHWLCIDLFKNKNNQTKLAMLNDNDCRMVVNDILAEGQNWLKISGLVYEAMEVPAVQPILPALEVRCFCTHPCLEHASLPREGVTCDRKFYLKLSREACPHKPPCGKPTHENFHCNINLGKWITHLVHNAHIEMGIN